MTRALITANRVSRGSLGDAFRLQILGEDGRTISVFMTPEKWALALWGRGDVEADVEWVDPEPEEEEKIPNRYVAVGMEGEFGDGWAERWRAFDTAELALAAAQGRSLIDCDTVYTRVWDRLTDELIDEAADEIPEATEADLAGIHKRVGAQFPSLKISAQP